jgi:glycosyltransferase involved in cell wall biosynthesis
LINFFFSKFEKKLKQYDYSSAQNVDTFIAISEFVRKRIKKYYNRDAFVIYPPVKFSDITVSTYNEGYYLIVSHLVPYKNIDLAIEAFNQNGKKLIIIGEGGERERLKSLVESPDIQFLQNQSREQVVQHLERCKAFIHPQVEDFGIAACEAQAAGKPVIALGKGGALETVVEGTTGIFFNDETPEALNAAIDRLSVLQINPEECRRNVERFSEDRFVQELASFFESNWKMDYRKNPEYSHAK